MRSSLRRALALTTAALAAALLAGCASPESNDTPLPGGGDEFPRTITVPAGSTLDEASVTIPSEPKRIAALTYETAELVAALGAADRLVMVPEAVTNPVLTHHLDEMLEVETKAPTESTTNAEAVIQTAPDLVLLSARHGLEEGAGRVLASAGIPVLILPNHWASVEDLRTNIGLVGEAIGSDAEAAALVATLDAGLAAKTGAAERPRVLVLSNQAGRAFVTAGKAFPLELLRLAGGEDAAEALGLAMTGPISAEQVIQADPDAILLIDMNGSGRAMFASILDTDAVAALPAVAEGRVLLLEGRQTQALGLVGVVDGLSVIADWLSAGG